MGQKDIISKEILKNIARDVAKHILHIKIEKDMELIDKEFTRIEKRDADLVFKNGDEIVHIEIQNNNHPKMHHRMLRYYSDIFFEYDQYKIRQYILYIGKERCSMQSKIKRKEIEYKYDIINITDISCQAFLQSSDPSAVVLSILCDFEGEDRQMVVNTIIKKLLKLSEDEQSFRSYLKMVEILSTNRNLESQVRKGEEMLSVDIEKMPSFNIGLEKGIERGTKEATLKNAMIMIEKFKLSIDDIVKEFNIKKEELLEYMKQKNEGKL